MVNYLLDTQYLVWFQENNPKIPQAVLTEIINPDNHIYFSQISLFEIAIKQQIGKLPNFTADVTDVYNEAVKENFIFLPILNSYLLNYRDVPLFPQHRDPFDRLLIAVAYTENITMITTDNNFGLYRSLIKIL